MLCVKYAVNDKTVFGGHLPIDNHQISLVPVVLHRNQRASITTKDKTGVLNRVEHIIIISRKVIMIFDNMKPPLMSQTDWHPIYRYGNIHRRTHNRKNL